MPSSSVTEVTNVTSVKWDTDDVLRIDKFRTRCYGWATSKNRPCQNRLAAANHQTAQCLLSKMSRHDPRTTDLDTCLRGLAHRLLCQRDHQGQATDVVRRWKEDIERHLESEDEEESEEDQAEVELNAQIEQRLRVIETIRQQQANLQRIEASIRVSQERLHTPIRSTSITPSRSHSVRTSNGAITAQSTREGHTLTPPAMTPTNPSTTAAGAPQQPSNSERPSVAGPEPTQSVLQSMTRNIGDLARAVPSSGADPTIPVIRPSTESEGLDDRPVGAPNQTGSSNRISTVEAASPGAAPEDRTATLLTAEPTRVPLSDDPVSDTSHFEPHASPVEQPAPDTAVSDHPRSISGDCPICYEEMLGCTNLEFCRAQCRQPFHRSCIATWLQQGDAQTCPYCRAHWDHGSVFD
ncbi:MAG: hypothetical protein Q9201_002303 [Fulgogasparrea decipioides]